MATNKPRKSDIQTPLREGEFWRISGIAEATEQRLKDGGIRTFDQLASLSPDEFAGILSHQVGGKERAVRQDWTGQARKLAQELQKSNGAEKSAEPVEPSERQHYESFMLELLLDEDYSVKRTRVANVRSGAKDGWGGWNAPRLLAWIAGQADFQLAPLIPDAEQELDIERARPDLSGTLQLSGLNITAPAGTLPKRHFYRGDQFQVQLSLDLRQVVATPDTPLNYIITLTARGLDNGQQVPVEITGECYVDQQILTLTLPTITLAPAIYIISAEASLCLQCDSSTAKELRAFIDGGVVQVVTSDFDLPA